MLILPADGVVSKVSVPLTVVMRTWVRVAESDLPPEKVAKLLTTYVLVVPEITQVFVEASRRAKVAKD